jgi:hypothetical protein
MNSTVLTINSTLTNNSCPYTNPFFCRTFWDMIQYEWKYLVLKILGISIHICIAILSVWPSGMLGNFRWFILNQTIASLLFTITDFVDLMWTIIDPYGHINFPSSNSFSYNLYLAVTRVTGGAYIQSAQSTTMLLTSYTRYVAVVKPLYYQQFMIPKRIFMCCLLSYFIAIPSNDFMWQLFTDYLYFCENIFPKILFFYLTVPPIVALVLNVKAFRALTKSLRGPASLAEKRELRDSRTIVIACVIDTLVPIVVGFPDCMYVFVLILPQSVQNTICAKFSVIFSLYEYGSWF